MKKILIIVYILGFTLFAAGQSPLPVIRAHSEKAIVHDNGILTIDYWMLDPRAKPDIYYINAPRRNSRISFVTDRDSISFDTRYGQVFDFIVLKGKDSCYVRISANYQDVINPTMQHPADGSVAIPFEMRGSRIYFNGTVNGHPGIAIQFDLGAAGCVVNKNSVTKTGVVFDGKTTMTNTQGTHSVPSGSNSTLALNGLSWDHIPVVQTENMNDDEDLIIGNSLFGDKILGIDYDKKIMTVFDFLPAIASGYRSQPVIYYQHRPRLQAAITIDGKKDTY